MRILVSTFWFKNYDQLVEKTGKNKIDYCHKHKYDLFMDMKDNDIEGKTPNDLIIMGGYENIKTIYQLLEQRPDVDAVFQIGSDAIITNTNIRLEDLMKPYEKFDIVTGSDRAGISSSQMFVRNTKKAKDYLEMILDGIAVGFYLHDQDFMWRHPVPYVFPTFQNVMNSYDCKTRLEPDDTLGNWKEGDFLVHLAGIPLDRRMEIIDNWLSKVK